MSAQENIEIAKQGYAAFSAGDAETAMANLADDLEWVVPGNSAVSGSCHGKAEVGALWAKMAEKSLTTTPEHYLGDEERVVVLTHVSAGGEAWDAADVLTYRDGQVEKIQSTGDTAKLEKVFGAG